MWEGTWAAVPMMGNWAFENTGTSCCYYQDYAADVFGFF